MKRIPALLCAALLCAALTGCAYDYRGPAIGGSVAVAPSGVYAGSVSVGTTYYASPFVFPVLPPLIIGSHHRHPHPPVYRPLPPPRPVGPAFRPGPPHGRPHGPALRPGPRPGHRPPAIRPAPGPHHRPAGIAPGPRPGHRPQAVRPGGLGGPRPPMARPGGGHRGPHGGPRPR